MRKSICPIGLECINRPCDNRSYCQNWCYPWDIPYTYEIIQGVPMLTVKKAAFRRQWTSQGTNSHGVMNQCPLPSGQYLAITNTTEEEYNATQEIIKEWEQYGWKAAESILINNIEDLILDNTQCWRAT